MKTGHWKGFLAFGLGTLALLSWGSGSAAVEVHLSGRVIGAGGDSLSGVPVKAFAGGICQAASTSDEQGIYSIDLSWDPQADPSVLVWWGPGPKGEVPELLLLHESRRARDERLWSPCFARLEPAPSLAYDVTLRTAGEKLEQLAGSDCLGHPEKE